MRISFEIDGAYAFTLRRLAKEDNLDPNAYARKLCMKGIPFTELSKMSDDELRELKEENTEYRNVLKFPTGDKNKTDSGPLGL